MGQDLKYTNYGKHKIRILDVLIVPVDISTKEAQYLIDSKRAEVILPEPAGTPK